jgi:type VI protein secretion system component VasK
MTQYPRNNDPYQQIEQQAREAMKGVSLEPNPQEAQQLDQELPQEWTQLLETELDPYRDEFTPKELEQFLDAPLDLSPEQERAQLAQEAIEDVDLEMFKQDVPQIEPPEPELDIER